MRLQLNGLVIGDSLHAARLFAVCICNSLGAFLGNLVSGTWVRIDRDHRLPPSGRIIDNSSLEGATVSYNSYDALSALSIGYYSKTVAFYGLEAVVCAVKMYVRRLDSVGKRT